VPNLLKTQVYTVKQAFVKAARFCAYQERTQQEVREKLREWRMYGDEAEEVICLLIQDNFINEERFAQTFAGGKFRLKKWGKVKIEYALRQKGLTEYCIRKGLAEIEDEAYQKTLEGLLAKKWTTIEAESLYERKHKIAQYAIQKGYESEMVWTTIKQMLDGKTNFT
jgi:regulatory protein